MQNVEDSVPLEDPGVAESGSCKPKTPGRTQKDKSILEDPTPRLVDTGDDAPKLGNEVGMNHDFHKEEKILLLLLLPRQNRLRSEIEEALNTDLLKQEAEHGALNVPRLSKYILNTRTLVCAPVRDEAVHRLDNITDSAWLLRGIFWVLDLMKRDRMNYTIQSLQSHLQEHSIQYERAKFQQLLHKQPNMSTFRKEPSSPSTRGTDAEAALTLRPMPGLLDRTIRWLTLAAADLATLPPACPEAPNPCGVACPSPNGTARSPEPLSPTMVLSQGFLTLLLWDPDDEELPETLLVDRARLQELQSQLLHLTILASVLLVTSSFSVSVLFGSPQFVDKLKRRIKAFMEEFNSRPEEAMLTVSEQMFQEINQSLENVDLAALSSDNTASLMGQLQDIAHKENCVRSVIDQRIYLFLKCCLVLGVQCSRLGLPGGLTLIEAALAELGQKFVSLMHHKQQAIGPYYTEILKTLIPSNQALEAEVESP